MNLFMTQAKLLSPKKLVLEQSDIPSPAPNEVIIKVKYAGLCGSDIHAYLGELPSVRFPTVPGHEFSGIITDKGRDVKKYKKGDRVVAEPFVPCESCYNCKHNLFYLCKDLKFMGFQSDGLFREYVAFDQRRIHLISEKLDFKRGTTVEPLAIAVHATKKAGISRGDCVLITGAGTIGILTLQVAKLLGAQVIITDILGSRLKIAKNLGADTIINVAETQLEDFLTGNSNQEKVDIIIDSVGLSSNMIVRLITMMRKGAKIISVGGITTKKIEIPIDLITKKEFKIMGSFLYTPQDWEQAIQYLKKELLDPSPLISHILSLDRLKEAYSLFINDKKRGKILINMEGT